MTTKRLINIILDTDVLPHRPPWWCMIAIILIADLCTWSLGGNEAARIEAVWYGVIFVTYMVERIHGCR